MKSKTEIEMDFARAISQAMELEELSKSISSLAAENMTHALRSLSCNWRGKNSEQFSLREDAVIQDMYRVSDELNRVAGNIRDIAEIVYKAERAALILKL